jgi:hypothetical protein
MDFRPLAEFILSSAEGLGVTLYPEFTYPSEHGERGEGRPYSSRGITSRQNSSMERNTFSCSMPPKSKLQPR